MVAPKVEATLLVASEEVTGARLFEGGGRHVGASNGRCGVNRAAETTSGYEYHYDYKED